METKLAEYRAKKEKVQNSRCSVVYSWLFRSSSKSDSSPASKESENISTVVNPPQCRQRPVQVVDQKKTSDYQVNAEEQSEKNWRDYIPLGLKILLWLCLWKFFIEIGFGAVYFVVSCSCLMYKNTRTEPRGEDS